MIHHLWKEADRGRLHGLIVVISTGAYLGYIHLAAPWDWISFYFRYLWLFLFAIVCSIAYRKWKASSGRTRGVHTWGELLAGLLFLGLFVSCIRGYFYSEKPVHLEFPLQEGWYYIGQGGNSPLVNYHNTHETQKYALDIVALNFAGTRAVGIYPSRLERYEIFGHTVYSPCEGIVQMAVDGLPDLSPPEADRSQPAGNHLVLRCEDVEVALAHFQQGSVMVSEGDTVVAGQPLAKVGNSGNTSEPHLHIHATRVEGGSSAGEPVPILFNGRFPVRNMIFRR